jgi:hypothetical protein
MEKKMASAIVFGIPEKTFRVLRFKIPIASMIKCNSGVERLRRDIRKWVLPRLAENEKILNTNIPASIIKMLEVGDGKWVELGRR